MKRILLIYLAPAAVTVFLAGFAAPSASAAFLCWKTDRLGVGNKSRGCKSNTGRTKNEYILADIAGRAINFGLFCALVFEAGTGETETLTACEGNNNVGPKEYVKVRFLGINPVPGPGHRGLKVTGGISKLTTGGSSVSCTNDSGTGEITGETTVGRLVITFTGCRSKNGSGPECTVKSTSAKTGGELVTRTLKGEVGEVAPGEEPPGAGLVLAPETAKNLMTIEGNACTVETQVSGSLAGELSPISSKQVTSKLNFNVTSGKQIIQEIDVLGSVKQLELEAFGSSAAEEAAAALTYEEAVEIA